MASLVHNELNLPEQITIHNSPLFNSLLIVPEPYWYVNNGLGNSLVPSGNKPLPEPMLTQIYVAMWHY